MSTNSVIRPWIRASRMPSQMYIFFPLLLGQALAYSQTRGLNWLIFGLAHLYGLLIQLYIVYANDLADIDTDSNNRTFTPFSGGSRVLVTGAISLNAMKKGTWLMVALNLLLGLVFGVFFQRPVAPVFVVGSLLLLWSYSYPPIRQSYRGGGEILQMLGVAGLLPLFGFYLQRGSIATFPWILIVVLLPIHLGCAIATSLPDYPSDKLAGKRTATVLLGVFRAKVLVMLLNWLSIGLLMANPYMAVGCRVRIALVPVIGNLVLLSLLQRADPGTKHLFYFVLFAILSIITLVAGLSLYFLW